MQDLANSIEAALKTRIAAGNIDVAIFTGQGDFTKTTPCCVVYAEAGAEMPLGSGNFTVSVSAMFSYPADSEELQAHRDLCSAVMGQLMDSTLAETMSAETDGLHVFGITNRAFSSGIDENQWQSTLRFDCYCCITDIPA